MICDVRFNFALSNWRWLLRISPYHNIIYDATENRYTATDSQEMLSMLLILLVTRLAHGQFCQNVADSSFGELRDRSDLNLARSVSVSLSDVDDETDEQGKLL